MLFNVRAVVLDVAPYFMLLPDLVQSHCASPAEVVPFGHGPARGRGQYRAGCDCRFADALLALWTFAFDDYVRAWSRLAQNENCQRTKSVKVSLLPTGNGQDQWLVGTFNRARDERSVRLAQ